MAREIFIPNSASIRNAGHVLRGVDWTQDKDEVTIRFHPRYCHLQPWVMSMLAAWALRHRAAGGTIKVENEHRAQYAWRFNLQDYLGVTVANPPTSHDETGRFIALRTVKTSTDLAELLADIVPLLHIEGEPAKGVLYAVSEMVRNVLEHSHAKDGAVVCAQNFRAKRAKRSYVSIGIADCGMGVRKSLGRNHPHSTDSKAVLHAIRAGVTGALGGPYGSSDNAGAGLFITRRLCDATNGYFALGSGDAIFRTSLAAKRPRDESQVRSIGSFPGTVVSVEIGLDPDSDFDTTLGLARHAFGEQMDKRRAEVGQRVRFS